TFRIYNSLQLEICRITYDLSDAVAAQLAWGTTGNTPLYNAFDLELRDGISTCKATDPARGLPTDLRDLFENGQWGLAIGDLDDIEPALKVDVASKGKLWAQDYAPYVMGVFLTADRRTAHEISWG